MLNQVPSSEFAVPVRRTVAPTDENVRSCSIDPDTHAKGATSRQRTTRCIT